MPIPEGIDELARKLGVAVEHLWPLLVARRIAFEWAVLGCEITGLVIFLSATITLVWWAFKVFDPDMDEDEIFPVLALGGTALVTGIIALFVLLSATVTIVNLLNPEAAVIESLMRSTK